MALKLQVTTQQGINADYWVIRETHINWKDKIVGWVMDLYASEQLYLSGVRPFDLEVRTKQASFEELQITGVKDDIRSLIYTFEKLKDFQTAQDVSSVVVTP